MFLITVLLSSRHKSHGQKNSRRPSWAQWTVGAESQGRKGPSGWAGVAGYEKNLEDL